MTMIPPKIKKWIALFEFEDRAFLQDNLNGFIDKHENCEVNTWTDNDLWYAQIMYEYKARSNDDATAQN